ncbi:MAG: hypothetical protein A3E84_03175 [Gammaproteobacteria bacterium RIFCSPHIGHO2_12_FULL_42_13]|nr:MAG: hypothetical protein A3E84_03175 [Gammaproteobacteria bacterium RIFCSPHIGHO2_12_FULL_42_13]
MLQELYRWITRYSVTLRFSILTIFIVLFTASMLSLLTLMYVQFRKSAVEVSLQLMQEACCTTAFNEIVFQLQGAESKGRSAANLLQTGIVDVNNQQQVLSFITNIIINEANIFPPLRSVYWADTAGGFLVARKEDDGTILSVATNGSGASRKMGISYYDNKGNLIQYNKNNNLDFNFDPRTRPWYLTAEQEKKTSWLPVYQYQMSGYLGTSIATPVYAPNGRLRGVISLNLRLDDLRRMIEKIPISKHGALFIINKKGKLVAFPNLVQFNNPAMESIYNLHSQYPWIVQSFLIYKKSRQEKFIFYHDNARYLAAYRALPPFGSHQWFIGAIAPEKDFTGALRKRYFTAMSYAIIILILCLFIVSKLVSRVIQSLNKITQEIKQIKQFELENSVPIVSRITEISYIGEALYAMKQSLRSFQKYVPAALVRQLIKLGTAAEVGGEKKSMAFLFSDIRDFTTISERLNPSDLAKYICDYFDALSSIIIANRGTIDKYIGDAIMAFWGAPLPEADPCRQAAKSALECVRRLENLNEKWQLEGRPELFTRFGIHVGDAIVGNFGSSERLNYTAIGDVTNTASRLEGINKIYGTQILVSDAVYRVIKEQFVLRLVDCVILKGKNEPSYIYELIAVVHGQLTYDVDAYNVIFADAFAAYQQQEWDVAIRYFSKCQNIYRDDGVAPLFIQRCNDFKSNPPPAGWRGVWRLTEK